MQSIQKIRFEEAGDRSTSALDQHATEPASVEFREHVSRIERVRRCRQNDDLDMFSGVRVFIGV